MNCSIPLSLARGSTCARDRPYLRRATFQGTAARHIASREYRPATTVGSRPPYILRTAYFGLRAVCARSAATPPRVSRRRPGRNSCCRAAQRSADRSRRPATAAVSAAVDARARRRGRRAAHRWRARKRRPRWSARMDRGASTVAVTCGRGPDASNTGPMPRSG